MQKGEPVGIFVGLQGLAHSVVTLTLFRALAFGFSGGLSPNICTDWNADGTPHKNSYYGGHFYNQGGCMGCHGSQGQSQGGDFSVIMAVGPVTKPEIPAPPTSNGAALVERNRLLK